jgi:hypothetical protein
MPISLTENYGGVYAAPVVKSQIKAMIDEYNVCQRALSTTSLRNRFHDRPTIIDTHCAWVSRPELEAFMKSNDGCDGVRIYFGAHNSSTIKNLGYEYQGQLTVILVATQSKRDSAGVVLANDDLLNDDKNKGPINFVSFLPNVPKGGSYTGGAGLDQYPLCPPNCSPGGALL